MTPTANVEIEVEDVSSEEDKLAAAAAETIKAAGQHRKQLVNFLYYFSTFIFFQTKLKSSQRLSPKLKGFPNSKYNFLFRSAWFTNVAMYLLATYIVIFLKM